MKTLVWATVATMCCKWFARVEQASSVGPRGRARQARALCRYGTLRRYGPAQELHADEPIQAGRARGLPRLGDRRGDRQSSSRCGSRDSPDLRRAGLLMYRRATAALVAAVPSVPNMWTAKWIVPADAPTGVVQVRVTARDKRGRTAEWRPFPDPQAHLTIVKE